MKHLAVFGATAALLVVVGFVRRAPAGLSSTKAPKASPAHVAPRYDPAAQERQVSEFHVESLRRRQELVAAVHGESDPVRRREREQALARYDLEQELKGLSLKRKQAEERGDLRQVAEIDRLVALKRARAAE